MAVLYATDALQVSEAVASAAAAHETLEIVGGGSKRGLGRPAQGAHTLDLSGLGGVSDYDPTELVLTARPATTMAEIDAMLAGQRQVLGFEPPDWSAVLGAGGSATLGGVIACNQAGPRRIRAGAARDHFLGFAAVNGRGDAWKAGGRVVKNVTGYDLCKLQAGAYGTLSVFTEITVRVLPQPETAATVLLAGLDDVAAVRAMATALNAPLEVSAAAHLPRAAAARSTDGDVAGLGRAVTAFRLEGPLPSVSFRATTLETLLGGDALRLAKAATGVLWREVGDVTAFAANRETALWRVCPTPSSAASVAEAVRARLGGEIEALYDWGGALLWLAIPPELAGPDGGAAAVREAVAREGGHATLLRASDAVRSAVAVFQPEHGALAALSRRVKTSFDPLGILNPGRMQPGF